MTPELFPLNSLIDKKISTHDIISRYDEENVHITGTVVFNKQKTGKDNEINIASGIAGFTSVAKKD